MRPEEITLSVPKPVYDEMTQHALGLAPIEACGYLAGVGTAVHQFYPMTNVDNSSDHFSFDPKEQFAAVKDARSKGWSLIGVYHSHPETPARLSAEDIRLFNDPNMIYVIVSLKNAVPEVGAFRLAKPSPGHVEITVVRIVVTE
ncbi:M67 family peptidase [bacterium]|nr:M67 family peptidase [bacterium]